MAEDRREDQNPAGRVDGRVKKPNAGEAPRHSFLADLAGVDQVYQRHLNNLKSKRGHNQPTEGDRGQDGRHAISFQTPDGHRQTDDPHQKDRQEEEELPQALRQYLDVRHADQPADAEKGRQDHCHHGRNEDEQAREAELKRTQAARCGKV